MAGKLLYPGSILSLSADTADRLMASGNGDAALLYLFLLLGMVPTVRNSLVSRANASRIYRLEKSGTRM